MVGALVYIVVVAVVIGLIYWVLTMLPIPEPFKKIITVLVLVVGVLIIAILLLQLVGISTPALGAAATLGV